MHYKKVAVIGGTGKSGKYLVDRLAEQSFGIRMLIRKQSVVSVQNSSIEIHRGDARNYKSVLSLIEGCDAVISTLGQPIGESSIFSKASKNVVQAMNESGVKRYIVTTGLNVNTPFDEKSEKVQFATEWMYKNFPETTKDKQIEYEFLTSSNINWTLVRLPLIRQTMDKFPINVNLKNCEGESISSTDLADFLIAQLDDLSYLKESPFLSNV